MYEGVYSDYSGLNLNLDARFNSQLPNVARTSKLLHGTFLQQKCYA